MKRTIQGGIKQMNTIINKVKRLLCGRNLVLKDLVGYNKKRTSYFNYCKTNGIKFY